MPKPFKKSPIGSGVLKKDLVNVSKLKQTVPMSSNHRICFFILILYEQRSNWFEKNFTANTAVKFKQSLNSGTILNIVSLQARWCRFRSKAGNRRDLQAGQPTYRFQQTAISLQYLSL